jgi:hypothetical protein
MRRGDCYSVMPALCSLVPGIHVLCAANKAWMAGKRGSPLRKRGGVTGPAMTEPCARA